MRQIFITVRSTGTVPVRFSADLTLRGNNQSKTGTLATAVAPVGQPVRITTGVYPFGGSLAGSTLSIAIRDCRPA